MPVYSLTEVKAMIVALDAKIASAESEQSYVFGGPGEGQDIQRGDLAAMYRERERLCKEYERLEVLSGSASTVTLAKMRGAS